MVRLGPCPIKNVFPVGMRLEIERHRADERRFVPQRQVLRRPAGLLASTAGLVEGVEKFVTQKRVLPGQRVPRIALDVFERADNL